MSLKETLNELFSKADNEVTDQFFWSGASESSSEDAYLEDSTREFFYTLDKQGISFKNEDSYGGEGMGDQYWSVYSFTKDNETVYIKFDGWYQSYNGSEFTEWFFVKPEQKTITVFEKDKSR